MSIAQETFDAATAPLRKGVNLVEASAGTGKTFAIAMLVLRFVTECNFPLQGILVVTFTKAATEELKERIRSRLALARDLLAGGQSRPNGGGKIDPALAAWRAGLADRGVAESVALHRLELALFDMDLAPVFTIHGFCQRMLQEQALESGQLFDFDLTKDISRLRAQIVEDYWRRNFYGLSPLHCALITEAYQTPDDLYQSVQGAGKRGARIEPEGEAVEVSLTRFDHNLNRLAAWWQRNAEGLRACFQDAVDQGKFTKDLQNGFSGWWQQVDDFLMGRSMQLPARLERLSAGGIMDELHGNKFRAGKEQSSVEKKQEFIGAWPLPEEELADFLQARQEVILAFRIGLVRELSTGLTQSLHRQKLLSFDDLISQLAKALVGLQGPALRQILGKRYPVALIDEFQDTDDAQYLIFSTIFAGQGRPTVAGASEDAGTTGSHYLYLIGDPKQAIYTFRGADIYSYFKAREQADIHLSLARNYRSHPALVEAVNRLFQLRENAFATPDLPYFPVLPARSADDGQLLEDGRGMAVMVYCELAANPDPEARDGRWSSTRATERIVAHVVAETVRLLRADNPIMLTAGEGVPMPLAPRDIAMLVRSHNQGEQLQTALARAGIPAVMGSQQSVFTTDECHDLFLLMQALCAPGDATLLKTALTSGWFGLTGPELYALWQAPEQVDLWLTRFHDYHQLWQEQGFLAMMTRLLESEKILITMARQPLTGTGATAGQGRSGVVSAKDGAGATRKISNIHHLLELIQAAEMEETMGPGKTLQWLQTMREGSRSVEDTELRLESDEEAVKIVTMHSAKGLEYPVVFCPFLWHRGNYIQPENGFVTCHDSKRELVMDLGSPLFEARKEQALREELAEELRLAYVALTRARCRCYAFWAEVKGSRFITNSLDSALAWLLSLEQGHTFAEQIQILQTQTMAGPLSAAPETAQERPQAEGESVSHVLIAAESDEPVVPAVAWKSGAEELMPLSFTGRNLHTDWLLHSYSSLAVTAPVIPGRSSLTVPHQPVKAASWSESSDSADLSPESLPDLPKGAQMGNVVHGLLENVPFLTLADGRGYEEIVRQQCAWFGVEASPGKMTALLEKVVRTPLLPDAVGPPFCLADLDPAATIREMPFYFHLDNSSTEQINAVLAGSPVVTPVTARRLQGYLTGFVDLICCHGGKFYIIDYKSNWLGNHLGDYGPQRLEQAMRDHNYGLQYWLYTLVLHRYLQTVLAGYHYATHFGGVMYLFVRGMEPTVAGSGVYFDLPDRQTLERLDCCLGRSSSIPGVSGTGPSLDCGHHCGGSENG